MKIHAVVVLAALLLVATLVTESDGRFEGEKYVNLTLPGLPGKRMLNDEVWIAP